jgi:hypothetical protein
VDFFEGRQWTEAQLRAMAIGKRPALQFNIIAPIVRLVLGYQRNNKTDIVYEAGQDTRASEDVAEVMTQIEKILAKASHQEFVDAEVFLDGLIGGRGYFDTRLDWENNDLGERKTVGLDPFTVYPDPDCSTYDFNESAAYVQTSKYISLDEIEGSLGKSVADLVSPWIAGTTPLAPLSSLVTFDEITPVRTYAEQDENTTDWWDTFYSLMGDFVDRHRKTIRAIETQHKVRELRNVIIDLETGDKKALPNDWDQEKIQKALLYCEMVGNPCIVQKRPVERIQCTTLVGDIIIYDAPSMFERYTITPYSPYFRRGMTRGMVEDLIDPQKEKNKRRSAEVEVVSKMANGGWKFHTDSLDPVMKQKLKKHGSTPGFHLEWKGTVEPKVIEPAAPPMAHERLESKSDEDMRRISGINEAALGQNQQKVRSGKAIEAEQRQAVVSIQLYLDNFKRSKGLLGVMHLSVVQNHYTEKRIYRMKGEGKQTAPPILINAVQPDPVTGAMRIVNDVTVGKYMVTIDDAPLSATFQNAQFEEMLVLLEKLGPAIGPFLPAFADLIIGMSSMPRKEEWIARLEQIAGVAQQQQQPGGQPGQGGDPGQPGAPQGQPQQPQPQPQQGGGAVVHAHPGSKIALHA